MRWTPAQGAEVLLEGHPTKEEADEGSGGDPSGELL